MEQKVKRVESLNLWMVLEEYLYDNGYRLWQTQHGIGTPEGFHAFFWKTREQCIEIITQNEEVCQAILRLSL